jgi:heterodisulfide reductase subunit A
MSEIPVTGVYIHHCINGSVDSVEIAEITSYASGLPGVVILGNSAVLPPVDKLYFTRLIREKRIKRLILAGDKPGEVKPFFADIMVRAGLNQHDLIVTSFHEFDLRRKTDTGLAKRLLNSAIMGTSVEQAGHFGEGGFIEDTLVIGGGIAGIQASLEIANSNHKVYLLERTGTIGGHMAMFDKTFPTLDCAACILTPKMVEIGQHPNIRLMTLCEVLNVTGNPGNFEVKILQKARRVDLSTCIGCGICSEKCPGKAASEFDNKTTLRKSIYIPFPQAVPNKYLIDPESCIYLKDGKCGTCVKVCPAGAVHLDETDKEITIRVGNIVVATGFQPFDARKDQRFGYGKFPNVVTSLEFERLVNASGPTGGNITLRTTDKKGNRIFTAEGKTPGSVALIHCIGSRDVNYHKYCSKVCCMYSLKLAHLIREKLPTAEISEYYIDIRAFGKGYEEFYERIREEGIHFIRGKTAKIEEKDGMLMLRSEDLINKKLVEQTVDMVILAVGLEPRDDARKLADMLGIPTDEEGWFTEADYHIDQTGTIRGGIAVAGTCQGPRDIPDSVAQASAAAASVIRNILNRKIRLTARDQLVKMDEK